MLAKLMVPDNLEAQPANPPRSSCQISFRAEGAGAGLKTCVAQHPLVFPRPPFLTWAATG